MATLRAAGADARALRRLLGGAAATVVVPSLVVAVMLEASGPGAPRRPPRGELRDAAAGGDLAEGASDAAGLAVAAAVAVAGRPGRPVRESVVADLAS